MNEREELVTQFRNVTGVSSERAKFFLESSAWELELALASFYENDGNEEEDLDQIMEQVMSERNRMHPPAVSPDRSPPSASMNVVSSEKPNQPKKAPGSSRISTLASLSRAKDSSSDEDEGQAFYAGGSEHSGQQVLGPGKKKRDIVSEMFKSVQEHGAEVVEPSSSSGRGRPSLFTGTGYKLGMSPSDETIAIPDNSSRRGSSSRHTEVVLKLWKSGFSINDGPLREYADPNNKEFLESIRKGEVPQELVHEARGSEVHLNMEDHRHEAFSVPKVKAKPFSGKGNMLGSPSPHTTASATALSSSSGSNEENETQAREAVPLNEDQPRTTVQIRLSDGSRLQGQFNHEHTIRDLRTYIGLARPAYQSHTYILLTTFPNRELTDESQTLAQAGLLNAAILQRLK